MRETIPAEVLVDARVIADLLTAPELLGRVLSFNGLEPSKHAFWVSEGESKRVH